MKYFVAFYLDEDGIRHWEIVPIGNAPRAGSTIVINEISGEEFIGLVNQAAEVIYPDEPLPPSDGIIVT